MSIYEEAAYLIEEYGWVQGVAGNKNMGFCISGALWEVHANSGTWLKATNDLDKILGGPNNFGGVIAWNDQPGRTKEEVIALLLKADANEI